VSKIRPRRLSQPVEAYARPRPPAPGARADRHQVRSGATPPGERGRSAGSGAGRPLGRSPRGGRARFAWSWPRCSASGARVP